MSPVEPVHDPRALGRVAARRPAEEPVHERPGRVARAGMDGDARGLVHDQQVLVLVRDAEVERCRDERRGRGRLELDLLAGLEAVRLGARSPVDEDAACVEEPLGRGPRADLLEPGEEPVEPEPGRVVCDADADQGRAAEVSARRRGLPSASSSDPSSTVTPITIDASARLNAGHQRRSRKSVT